MTTMVVVVAARGTLSLVRYGGRKGGRKGEDVPINNDLKSQREGGRE